MPSFDIIRKSQPKNSFRVQSVKGSYDLQDTCIEERFTGDIELPKKWNVGLIVGKSGTGKSTIAKELFGDFIVDNFEYTHDNILDDMPKNCTVQEICKMFTSVGFASVTSWLKPYEVLSNGEKMRVDLARGLLENKDIIAFDEYTSVVDRHIAKIGSLAIQKTIRKQDKKFIAITCHYDVQEWLMPDWIFNTDTMQFQVLDLEAQKKNRPNIQLDIYETKRKSEYWNIFSKYHYLNHSFNKAARVFVCYVNNQLAGFWAILPFPHPKVKNIWRGHRMVVLPDFQGIGIASVMSNFVGELFWNEKKVVVLTTTNPAMINCLKNQKKWAMTRIGRVVSAGKTSTVRNKHNESCNRITASFRYVGGNG